MKDYKEAIESIMKDTTSKVMDHAIKAYHQGYENGLGKAQTDSYVKGYEDGQKEKPQVIYEMKVEEYNKGLNEAWECAKKLCQSEKYGGLQEHCAEIFGREDVFDVFDYSASQYIEKVKAYEERKKCENCKRTKDPIFYGHCVGECDYAKQTEDEIKFGKALSQEPCTDAVSREAVLKIIDGWYEQNRDIENIEDLIILITYMNSVQPKTVSSDVVSKTEVKRIVDFYKEQYDGIYHINESIEKLPSVNPQPICEEREKGECPYYAG